MKVSQSIREPIFFNSNLPSSQMVCRPSILKIRIIGGAIGNLTQVQGGKNMCIFLTPILPSFLSHVLLLSCISVYLVVKQVSIQHIIDKIGIMSSLLVS